MTQASTSRFTHWLLIGSIGVAGSGLAQAETTSPETEQNRSARSISFTVKDAPVKAEKDQLLKQSEIQSVTTTSKSTFRQESNSVSVEITSIEYTVSPEYTLFDASSDLISDFDHDGFYHRFAITIDADTVYNVGYVYAKLYLSYEGGPWEHFATSHNYHIYGDSADDAFTIETELADGFHAGHYDIRIELYDADHQHWLLSYGPYDDGSLSNLPLEDSYYDGADPIISLPPVEAEIVVAAQGSMHALWALLPGIVFGARLMQRKSQRPNAQKAD